MFSIIVVSGCEPGLKSQPTARQLVMGGEAELGSPVLCKDAQGTMCAGDHVPHTVKLSGFFLDVTEVTRLQYGECVLAGACPAEAAAAFDADHKDEPVLVDTPDAARKYCTWKQQRLPTEAEFEYAARLGSDGKLHTYPWGDADPTCDRLGFAGCNKATPAVGESGDVTAGGIHDLAGSAPEWVEDSYLATAGCGDRLSYADLCWGRGSGCGQTRCTADADLCQKGCLPPSEEAAGAQKGGEVTSEPVCPAAPKGSTPLVDPVVRAPTSFAVVRGGGATDRACTLAGYTRRHATPLLYRAGFRCAVSAASGTVPQPALSYRFSFAGCPRDAYMVKVKVTVAGGTAAGYDATVYPADASAKPAVLSPTAGSIDVPCGGTVVLRPQAPGALTLTVSDAEMCLSGTRTVDLSAGGDVPAAGADVIALMGQNCGKT